MDNFEKIFEDLVKDCLSSAKIAYLPSKEKKEMEVKLKNHFYDVTINTLLDQLSDDQILEIKALGPKNPKVAELMSQFAASIPGFSTHLEDKLNQEVDKILQSGQIPLEIS